MIKPTAKKNPTLEFTIAILADALVSHLRTITVSGAEVPVASMIFRISYQDDQEDLPEKLRSVKKRRVEKSADLLACLQEALVALAVNPAGTKKRSWFSPFIFEYKKKDEPMQIELISFADNQICEKKDPCAHSEILAIRRAAQMMGRERLEEFSLLTTLEPCLMCSGAIILARLQSVYYCCPTDRGIGLAEILELAQAKKMQGKKNCSINHLPKLVLLRSYQNEVQQILKSFFGAKRG